MCNGFTTDVIGVNTKMYSVTSESTYSSSRCVSSFKDSSAHQSSVSIVMCIFLAFRYIFLVFTTSSVLAIRKNSLFVKSTFLLFSSADEPLKDKKRLLLLWKGSLVTLDTCVYPYNICGEASAQLYSEEQSF